MDTNTSSIDYHIDNNFFCIPNGEDRYFVNKEQIQYVSWKKNECKAYLKGWSFTTDAKTRNECFKILERKLN